jgi:hypothetical protein
MIKQYTTSLNRIRKNEEGMRQVLGHTAAGVEAAIGTNTVWAGAA